LVPLGLSHSEQWAVCPPPTFDVLKTTRGPVCFERVLKRKELEAGFKGGTDQDASLRGQVLYNDEGIELRMKSTSITAYLEKGLHSRRIQGTAEINGQDGTYQLDVSDDESASDSFAIRLSNGYSATGQLKGGHIEIHKRCRNDNGTPDENSKDKEDDDD
jgi:hypothetical protein